MENTNTNRRHQEMLRRANRLFLRRAIQGPSYTPKYIKFFEIKNLANIPEDINLLIRLAKEEYGLEIYY
jgi:hypothetical protein